MTSSTPQPKRMTREEYREVYLRSDHWRETRLGALERAEHRCQVCNSAKRLDVHHRTYERIGEERPADLTVLCRMCHDVFHSQRRVQPAPKLTKAQRKAKRRGEERAKVVPVRPDNGEGSTYNWSWMTAEQQRVLCKIIMRTLAEGDATSKQIGARIGYRTQAVGSACVALRRQHLVCKTKNSAWQLDPGNAAVVRGWHERKAA